MYAFMQLLYQSVCVFVCNGLLKPQGDAGALLTAEFPPDPLIFPL